MRTRSRLVNKENTGIAQQLQPNRQSPPLSTTDSPSLAISNTRPSNLLQPQRVQNLIDSLLLRTPRYSITSHAQLRRKHQALPHCTRRRENGILIDVSERNVAFVPLRIDEQSDTPADLARLALPREDVENRRLPRSRRTQNCRKLSGGKMTGQSFEHLLPRRRS